MLKPGRLVLLVLAAGCLALLCLSSPGEAEIKEGFSIHGFFLKEYEEGTPYYISYEETKLLFIANETNGDRYQWNFDDGSTKQSSDYRANYIYGVSETQEFDVELTVSKGNETSDFEIRLVIYPLPDARVVVKDDRMYPVAALRESLEGDLVDVFVFEVDEGIRFDASGSKGQNITDYEWDLWVVSEQFNTASPEGYGRKTDVAILSFSYHTVGYYPIQLVVSDENKQSDYSHIAYIKIVPVPEEDKGDYSFFDLGSQVCSLPFILLLVLLPLLAALVYRWSSRHPGEKTTKRTASSSILFPDTSFQKTGDDQSWLKGSVGNLGINDMGPNEEMEYSQKLRKGSR